MHNRPAFSDDEQPGIPKEYWLVLQSNEEHHIPTQYLTLQT